MSRLSHELTESRLARIWQRQSLVPMGLFTEDGEPIAIIYPGRANDDHGADFRDAVVLRRHGMVRGDIELHIRTAGWQEHRHHRDAAYNRVVLHVVMWHNAGTVTRLQNGGEVPVLALHRYLKLPAGRPPVSTGQRNLPCRRYRSPLKRDGLASFLNQAGDARFRDKAARFLAEWPETAASQSLYQGLMEALGYARNKLSFRELARRLPLSVLESAAADCPSDEDFLSHQQALLLGSAGLLPSQRREGYCGGGRADPWLTRLERWWAAGGRRPVMAHHDWRFFKVRPSNWPQRRLVAMSYLLRRYRREGLLAAAVNMVSQADGSRAYYGLESALRVSADGYWASRSDCGPPGRLRTATLLGRGRAASIVINVLLPFVFAWGQLTAQPELERQAFDLYRGYPALPANAVERHMMRQLGQDNRTVSSARRQQGLIHVYHHLCTQGRCDGCSLGQPETGDNV